MKRSIQFVLFFLLWVASTVQQNVQDIICETYSDGQFVGDPSDCSRFYMCENGHGIGASCPPGMLFDSLDSRCSFEHETNCYVTSEPEKTTLVFENAETTTAVGEQSELCSSADPSAPSFHPSKTNCEEYFICTNQRPYQMTCARGQHWNQQKRYCDNPETANCQIEVPVESICPTKGYAFFPHPEICEFFLYCNFGELSVQMCPFYFQWDVFQETCVLKHIASCTKSSVSEIQWNRPTNRIDSL